MNTMDIKYKRRPVPVLAPEQKAENLQIIRPVDQLFSVKEASRVLKIGEGTTRSLIRSGQLRAMNLNGAKIRGSELDRFMAQAEGMDYTDIEHPKPVEWSE